MHLASWSRGGKSSTGDWNCYQKIGPCYQGCCVLHNYLNEAKDLPAINQRLNPDGIPYLSEDRAILDVQNLHGYHTAAQAKGICDIITGYFNSLAPRCIELASKGSSGVKVHVNITNSGM